MAIKADKGQLQNHDGIRNAVIRAISGDETVAENPFSRRALLVFSIILSWKAEIPKVR